MEPGNAKAEGDRVEATSGQVESARVAILAACERLNRICRSADSGDRLDSLRLAIGVRNCRLTLAAELVALDAAIRSTEAAS